MSDPDRDLHSHPWTRAISLILVGGYREERVDRNGVRTIETHRAGELNFLRGDEYHRVTLMGDGGWTLFCSIDRFQDWGFLVDGKHVSHRDYLAPLTNVVKDWWGNEKELSDS